MVERTGVAPDAAATVVDTFLNEIYQSLKRGESLNVLNFGAFCVRPKRDSWVL